MADYNAIIKSGEGVNDLFPDLQLSDKAKKRLQEYYALEGHVDRSAIMTCPGANECVHAKAGECPIADAGDKLPVSKPCPIEALTFKKIHTEQVEGVMSLDPNQKIAASESLVCRDIAAIELEIRRIRKSISRDPEPAIDVDVGVDKMGNALQSKQQNPAYSTLNALYKDKESAFRRLRASIDTRNKLLKNKVEVEEADERLRKVAEQLNEKELLAEDSPFAERMSQALEKEDKSYKERVAKNSNTQD